MKLTSTIRGLKKLDKVLKTESRRQEKLLETAVKVEGFRLMRQLKKEIREGSPGGRKFKGLTFLSRAWGGKGRLRPDKPLRALAIAVRYLVNYRPFSMQIGWVGPRVSKSWKRIAEHQQEGFTRPVTKSRRAYFLSTGKALGKRSMAKKYMFLRKGTTRFETPARPIMDPFWRAERRRAFLNIRENYIKKLKGERI